MTKKQKTFEQSMQELETIVQQMENGEMPLDKMLESYRRGVELVGYCRHKLDTVQMEIKKLENGKLLPMNDDI